MEEHLITRKKILITGAAGFIGSCMTQYLNEYGYENLILVDDFSSTRKIINWKEKKYNKKLNRNNLFEWLAKQTNDISIVIHLGARTDTAEFNYSVLKLLNVEYSKKMWIFCSRNKIPLVYASSASTYGAGDKGYDDNHETIEFLSPLSQYGISKNEFDKWALKQEFHPPSWIGLKFFNVYGPNEYHKAQMASVIFHSFNQILKRKEVRLYKSHKNEFKDGQQLRDFIYVKDVVKVIFWLIDSILKNTWSPDRNGLYNLGTGGARTFYDLASAVFYSLNMPPNIKFIDMPVYLRNTYQYHTQAKMEKLLNAGYKDSFYSLEAGIEDYTQNFLNYSRVW